MNTNVPGRLYEEVATPQQDIPESEWRRGVRESLAYAADLLSQGQYHYARMVASHAVDKLLQYEDSFDSV